MYIQLISIHGLVRGRNIEMGRDADTGGQVRYVIELARNLAQLPGVDAVDLFTRRIRDKRVSPDYSQEIEELGPNCRIVRLPCGGGRYIRKEKLWPYLDDFVDAMISFTRQHPEGIRRTPSVVHGHYADAGYVAKGVASVLGVPFIFTGHSLGKPKLAYLLEEGWTVEKADKELAITHRINVEQECLATADLVITSTRHERDEQYGEYYKDDDLDFEVIPPGTDLERFFPYYEYDLPHPVGTRQIDDRFKQARVRMQHDLARFFRAEVQPDRPLILALCRPDRRKNIHALVQAYGESKELQAIANLAVVAGIRDDIESMPENEKQVLTEMLLAMDRYDLYGKMAIPKDHDSEYEVPELYRLAAASRGVFANTAFVELFGLTAIEASATGLPFVVTANGGPQDIVQNCKSGLLVDVYDRDALTSALIKLLTNRDYWEKCSTNGINLVRKYYSWERHCNRYLECIQNVVSTAKRPSDTATRTVPGQRLAEVEYLLIADIDNTLLGDDEALARLKDVMAVHRGRIGFGVATGRALELAADVLGQSGITDIDVIVTAVGSEIYYTDKYLYDKGWASRLRSKWQPDRIRAALDPLPYLFLQTEEYSQREFKISYDLADNVSHEKALAQIQEALAKAGVAHSLIFSHGTFVDVLPYRASKGKAIRYLAGRWNLPLCRVITAGDSGNDRDMLVGETAGIVVGNHDPELADLKESDAHRVYFAEAHCAGGILEGLAHYGVFESGNGQTPYERSSTKSTGANGAVSERRLTHVR
jgi:sucrose-phosphate synthase